MKVGQKKEKHEVRNVKEGLVQDGPAIFLSEFPLQLPSDAYLLLRRLGVSETVSETAV
jgi:hypothetical protein